jgi:hypothetical protein
LAAYPLTVIKGDAEFFVDINAKSPGFSNLFILDVDQLDIFFLSDRGDNFGHGLMNRRFSHGSSVNRPHVIVLNACFVGALAVENCRATVPKKPKKNAGFNPHS